MKSIFNNTLLTVFFIGLTLVAGCSSSSNSRKTKSEKEVYELAQDALRVSNWERAIEYLGLLEEFYPFGLYAEQSQLELIYANFRNDDFELAIASADRFIRLNPQHRNIDYAYYMRGISSYSQDSAVNSFSPVDITQKDIGTARDAFNYFGQFLSAYPSSPYALDAQKRMTYLKNVMARSEINVANYYFKREAYLAAANRGRFVVENMQGTPAVPDALATMAMGYFMLGKQELANTAAQILEANYPDYPALKDGAFDFEFNFELQKTLLSYATLGLFDKRPTIKFDTRKKYDPFYSNDFSDIDALSPTN